MSESDNQPTAEEESAQVYGDPMLDEAGVNVPGTGADNVQGTNEDLANPASAPQAGETPSAANGG